MAKMAKKATQNTTRTTLVSLQAWCAEVGVPYTSARDLVLRGFLPRVQLGNSTRLWIKRSDGDRLIAASTETEPR